MYVRRIQLMEYESGFRQYETINKFSGLTLFSINVLLEIDWG